jgi:signal transduction histidine kinase
LVLSCVTLHAQNRAVVGYNENPPLTMRNPAGQPSGFLVEALSEAAKEQGIALDWSFLAPGKTPEALQTGQIDLYPGAVNTPERRALFHFTSPWWHAELLLVSRAKTLSIDNLQGRRISHTSSLRESFPRWLPKATPVLVPNHRDAFVQVCRSQLDGVLLDRIMLDRLLLARPPECTGVDLEADAIPGAKAELAIISRHQARQVAERLRLGLETITEDGRLAEISLKYPSITAASSSSVASMFKLQYRYRLTRSALIVACILLGAVSLLVYHLRRENRRRKRTEDALRRANLDLEHFAYAASHDLTEPIRNMSLFAELLQRRYGSQLDEAADQQISFIMEGGKRMQALLRGLLSYTNVRASSQSFDLVDAGDVLHQVCDTLIGTIEQKNALVEWCDLPQLRIAQSHLVQLFQNLVSNALKYAGPDNPRVTVTAACIRNEWILSVKDNGPGIDPMFHARVFDAFKRLHGREIEGSGMGLAICRRIVENYGGRIWVESRIGTGADFRIAFPESLGQKPPISSAGRRPGADKVLNLGTTA